LKRAMELRQTRVDFGSRHDRVVRESWLNIPRA
jgi:hypothetical protein